MTDLPPHPGIDGTQRTDSLLSLDDGDIQRIRRAVVDQVRSLPFPDRCAPARIGEFAVEETVLLGWASQNWYQGVGVLLAKRPERPPGSADPRTEEAWYIQYGPGPGDVSRWTNCAFTAIPAAIAEPWHTAEPAVAMPGVRCDPALPSALSPVPHDYDHAGDDYGSLADGGSYEELRCRNCGRTAYSPLPD